MRILRANIQHSTFSSPPARQLANTQRYKTQKTDRRGMERKGKDRNGMEKKYATPRAICKMKIAKRPWFGRPSPQGSAIDSLKLTGTHLALQGVPLTYFVWGHKRDNLLYCKKFQIPHHLIDTWGPMKRMCVCCDKDSAAYLHDYRYLVLSGYYIYYSLSY